MSTTVVALQVEKGVPMPVQRYTGRSVFAAAVNSTLPQMKVGDSFSFEDPSKSKARLAAVRSVAKHLGIKVTGRKVGEKEWRVWRTE